MVNQAQQRGSVLLISLMLLIILTLMTFTLSNSVLLQQKMTTENKDDALALQVAEFALRDAEQSASAFAVAGYFTKQGSSGLYDGRNNPPSDHSSCDIEDDDCYLKSLDGLDYFDSSNWVDSNSRVGTTKVPCPHGDACPVDGAYYQSGRYKMVLLGEVDITLSGSNSIRVINNQNQNADDIITTKYWLYRVIATGTGVGESSRRVIVSHFVAPAP